MIAPRYALVCGWLLGMLLSPPVAMSVVQVPAPTLPAPAAATQSQPLAPASQAPTPAPAAPAIHEPSS
ncbi:MAG: hypothetical protein ACRETG_04065, partial [Steroidobacteraceae bacterium]